MTRDKSNEDHDRPVVKCVCFDITFAELKAYASAHQCGMEGLTERFGCGRGCALCVPYIQRMLRTGETRFPVILSEDE